MSWGWSLLRGVRHTSSRPAGGILCSRPLRRGGLQKPLPPLRRIGMGLVPLPLLGVLHPPPERDGPADEPPSKSLARAPPRGKVSSDPTNARRRPTAVKNSSVETTPFPPPRRGKWNARPKRGLPRRRVAEDSSPSSMARRAASPPQRGSPSTRIATCRNSLGTRCMSWGWSLLRRVRHTSSRPAGGVLRSPEDRRPPTNCPPHGAA